MVVITTFRPPESPLKLEQRNISVILDKKNIGTGSLFISEKTLSWQKDDNVGFSMEYYNISLHAVSRDPSVCDRECIYILTDPHIELPGENPVQPPAMNEEDSDAESEPDLSELILVPEDPSQIQDIYDAIKLCQELNPDPADVDDDDNIYEDAEGEMVIERESLDGEEINHLTERLQNHSVDVQYNYRNGNEDEDFEDAD